MKKFYCNGKKGICEHREICNGCEYLDGSGGTEIEVDADERDKQSDVVREIFAEIEKEIDAAIESNYRAKKEHYNRSVIPNYDNFNAMCDGKIYAMRGLLDFIAELKKKYTESENDNGKK